MCAEITVLPSGLHGSGPNRYHPAIAGFGGNSMKPPDSTPTGTTSMSIPAEATCTRTGGTAARPGVIAPSTMGTSYVDVGAGVGEGVGEAEGAPAPLGEGAGAHAERATIST